MSWLKTLQELVATHGEKRLAFLISDTQFSRDCDYIAERSNVRAWLRGVSKPNYVASCAIAQLANVRIEELRPDLVPHLLGDKHDKRESTGTP